MRFTVVQRPPGQARWGRNAFDSQIGKVLPVKVNGRTIGAGTLVAAKVRAGGTEAELTFDLPGEDTSWVPDTCTNGHQGFTLTYVAHRCPVSMSGRGHHVAFCVQGCRPPLLPPRCTYDARRDSQRPG